MTALINHWMHDRTSNGTGCHAALVYKVLDDMPH